MRSPELVQGWLLGVDGGGTKTHFLLSRADASERAGHVGPGAYYLEVGIDGVAEVLGEGITALCRAVGIGPDAIAHAFFGLPAYGESPAGDAALRGLGPRLLGHDRYTCDNDVVCAWAGSLGGADGIHIVAGTGSIAYGRRGDSSARCGGWGEIFGDEGSAYWTAARGLNAFTRMSDGRLPRGTLYALFRDHLQLKDDFEILERFLEQDRSRKTIAGLAPLVSSAAALGDATAKQILADAAAALAWHAATMAEKLGYATGETVPVSYSGGMFKRETMFVERLDEALQRLNPHLSLRDPIHSPHVGAVLAAARCGGLDREPTVLPALSAALAQS